MITTFFGLEKRLSPWKLMVIKSSAALQNHDLQLYILYNCVECNVKVLHIYVHLIIRSKPINVMAIQH